MTACEISFSSKTAPTLTGDNEPSIFSRTLVTGILREQMGFPHIGQIRHRREINVESQSVQRSPHGRPCLIGILRIPTMSPASSPGRW